MIDLVGMSCDELVNLASSRVFAQWEDDAGLQALDQLAELTADLPPVDAVQIAQESREALDARSSL